MTKLEQIRAVATKAITGSITSEMGISQILELLGPIDRTEPPIGERPMHALTVRQYAELCFASRGATEPQQLAANLIKVWEYRDAKQKEAQHKKVRMPINFGDGTPDYRTVIANPHPDGKVPE